MLKLLVRLCAIVLLISTSIGYVPGGSAQEATPSPMVPTAVPKDGVVRDPDSSLPLDHVTPAEQELANRYAPIAYLRTQPADCSSVGERYIPIAVDITLNNPEVRLRRHKRDGETSDPVVKVGPSAQDLVATDASYYIDLPGDSLEPGCGYEKWSRARIAELGLTPSVYAHIATQTDRPGKLALQYWFYYAFDNYNNSHESDWEMIQLTFEATTPEEALAGEPTTLSYAQHSGGENADWNDDKVQLEDGRLVTFPAEGSHADYYQDAVWLAWGEDGSGFGCDQSQEDLTRFDLKVIVIPQKIDSDGPFAWALFQGRWGEYQPWQFNGPKSPNIAKRWIEPIGWTDDLRLASYPIPHEETFGIAPSEFFCVLSTEGGNLAKQVQVHPTIILGAIATVIVGLLLTTLLTRRYLWGAIKLYAAHAPTFLLSAVLVLVVAAFTAWLRRTIEDPSVVRHLTSSASSAISVGSLSDNGGIGVLLQYMLIGLVAPGIIAATIEITRTEQTDYLRSLRSSFRKIPIIVGALLLNYVILLLMSITIVLIPLAIYRQIQWAYTPHAILIDGAGVRSARNVSRTIIQGDWFRTLGMAILVTLVSGIPGPLVGLVLILTQAVSLEAAGLISSLTFGIVYPITIIASTLYYRQRREHYEEAIAAAANDHGFHEFDGLGRLRGSNTAKSKPGKPGIGSAGELHGTV